MNRRMILYTVGRMLMIEALLMQFPTLTGLIYHEKEGFAFLVVGICLLILGYAISFRKPKNKVIYAKEGLAIVGLSWLVLSVFGAIPFCLTKEIPSYIDAFFEIVSGFTTTGSSILTNVEALSHASLFWRSFSHWIGGMGILVFVVAVLPDSSKTTFNILKAEMPGPIVGKLVSKIKVTARILYIIYTVLTIVEVILLMMGGMPFFDSLLNSFGTAGTGGFAIWNNSIAHYNSAYVDGIITFFMILFGINFNILYFIVIKKFSTAFRSEEVRWYLGIIAAATMAITINIMDLYPSVLTAFRYAVFQVGSIITTTGYVTADYGQWPLFSQMIIVLLTFIGACAGSTGGGMKVSRIVMYFKHSFSEMKKMVHPRSVAAIKFEGQTVSKPIINNLYTYLFIYLAIFFSSMLVVSLQNIDFTSAFTAVATCLNNVGPGLGIVGPVGNFASLSPLSKLVLCFDMLAGRLEIFPILMIFSKYLWKR